MPETKTRTLHYRRIAWIDDANSETLQKLVENAHRLMSKTKDRTFPYGRGEIQGLRIKEKRNVGLFLHISYSIPDQPTSIVPKPSEIDETDVGTANPPRLYDFMEGDVMILLRDNHLVYCSNGAHESVLQTYFEHCLNKIGYEDPWGAFSIEKVANVDKTRLLRDEGVQRLKLGASLYDASVDYLARHPGQRTIKDKLVGRIRDEILDIFSEDSNSELREYHDRENLQVLLEIRFDSRKKGGEIGRKRIEKTAEKLVEEEDEGFVIVTGTGKQLKPSEVVLNTKKSIKIMGKSVNCSDAWKKLENYMNELHDLGMLAQ